MGVNFNATSHKAVQYRTQRTIRQEADFPELILAPDGVMRHPLDISVDYVFDIDDMTLANGFIMPSRLLGFERARFRSLTNTTVNYSGTAPIFWGRNQGPFETDKVDYVGIIANNPVCFDMVATDGIVALTIFNTAFVDIDVGLVDGFSIIGYRVGFHTLLDTFHIHDATRCFMEVLTFNVPSPSTDFPIVTFTGGNTSTSVAFNNAIVETIGGSQSLFSIDFNAVFNQMFFTSIPFDNLGGSFFELDLTGGISAFADLSLLIIGTPTVYENDPNGGVLVTDVGHDVYGGLTVNHSGTTNYNGSHTVLRIPGNDQYVMDATYVGDEFTGNYTGIGTRVTTAAAHKLTSHRTTDITGTMNYDAAGLEVLNAVSPDFDITTPFVSNDATGTYMTTSVTQVDIGLLAQNNGALPNSMTQAETNTNGVFLGLQTGQSSSEPSIFIPVENVVPAPGDWIKDPSTQRFTVDTTTGIITYIGKADITVDVRYEFSDILPSAGSQNLQFILYLNGTTPIPKTQINLFTQDSPTANYTGGILTLSTLDTLQLFTRSDDQQIKTTDMRTKFLILAV